MRLKGFLCAGRKCFLPPKTRNASVDEFFLESRQNLRRKKTCLSKCSSNKDKFNLTNIHLVFYSYNLISNNFNKSSTCGIFIKCSVKKKFYNFT